MPELPEVETIRRGLEKYIVGQEIADIEVLSSRQFTGDPKLVIGAKIIGVRRFGKGLVIDLANGFSIAIHVKMTGQLIYREYEVCPEHCEKLPNKWTRAVFKIKDQKSKIKSTTKISKLSNTTYTHLYYNDIRKFGWIRIVKTDKVMELPFFKNLGPEPFFAKVTEGQASLTVEKFRDILASTKAPVKSVLMDQHKISGIGNIYANEALFLARINPLRSASSLNKIEAKRLLEAVEEVLRRGIEAGGSSMTNYVNALGEKGTYQEYFLVYGQEGKRCPVCKGTIEKMKMGGRGTFYCKKCQKYKLV